MIECGGFQLGGVVVRYMLVGVVELAVVVLGLG